MRKQVIALALGSGSARGWAHLGVIRALEQAGIRPDIVCGTSIGALIAAAYSTGDIERFEAWTRALKMRDVLSLMDFHLNGGMLKGERLMTFFEQYFKDRPIEALQVPFAAVATDLHTGQEVWLREGSVKQAVRASIALPGLFSPVWLSGRLLVDGGLVNPVPVSLARAMGADIVIAVDLNSDILGRHLGVPGRQKVGSSIGSAWRQHLPDAISNWLPVPADDDARMPSLIDILASSINIMQVRITRSRMAGDPADAVITPELASLGLMDFHKAETAIAAGEQAARAALPALYRLGVPINGSPPEDEYT